MKLYERQCQQRQAEQRESAEIRERERRMIGPRSDGYISEPTREGNGTGYHYSRTIYGVRYGFTAVSMPNGERRYFVTRYNGYGDDGTEWGRSSGMRFGCAWTPVHSITRYPDK